MQHGQGQKAVQAINTAESSMLAVTGEAEKCTVGTLLLQALIAASRAGAACSRRSSNAGS